jgi:hypothetical protein
MIVAAYPLYLAGGPHAVLLLPMLGAIACALAAAALARRLAGGDGMAAFWIIGLASPVAIYALDFWEHSIGLALMLWGVTYTWDVMERRAGWRGALVAGALFGFAATMRSEALVYFVVTFGLACLVMLWRDRRLVCPVVAGLVALAGVGVMVVGNRLLEQLLIGSDLRGARVAGTAAGSGDELTVRVHEALTTAVGLGVSNLSSGRAWVLGGFVVALIGGGAWLLRSDERVRIVAGGVLLAFATLIYLSRFDGGLGFVPGLFTAAPFAAVGALFAWRVPALRWPALVAAVALPIVWATDFTGGADPQWGGRYILLSGALLTIAGIVALQSSPRALCCVVALSALVTLGGLTWLTVRSHTVADGVAAILSRHDEMLIARPAHFLREAGAFYDADRKWLTATTSDELLDAVAIAEKTGTREFAVIDAPDRRPPRQLGTYERRATELVSFIRPDVRVSITTYRAH